MEKIELSKTDLEVAYKYMHIDMIYEKINIKLLEQFFHLEIYLIPDQKTILDNDAIDEHIKDKLTEYIKKIPHQKVDTYEVVKKVEREISLEKVIKEKLDELEKKNETLKNNDKSKAISEAIVENSNKTSFSSKNFNNDKVSFNNFIVLNLNDYFIDYTLLTTLGRKIDSCLPDYLYANRINNKESKTLFKPYFFGYSKYTNDLISNVKENIENKNDIIVFQIDFTRFYYHINLDNLKKDTANFIESNNIEITSEETRLLHHIYKIHKEYDEKFKIGLPLGLKSSGLFANIAALKIDNQFQNERPLFYGRYVDDITLVFKKEYDDSGNPKELIKDYLKQDSLKDFFEEQQPTGVKKLSINKSKTVMIDIPNGVDVNYIKEFENKLKKTGSGFNLIFNPTGIGDKISQIYSNSNSIVTKSSQMIDMKKNSTSIKMFIGALFDWYKTILLKDGMKIHQVYKSMYEKYWQEFISCVDDLTLIELSSYWINLFLLDNIFNSEQKNLKNRIENIVMDSDNKKLKKILKITINIYENYLSNNSQNNNMLTARKLNNFQRRYINTNEAINREPNYENRYKTYIHLHKLKIYERQIFEFESQLLNSNIKSFDVKDINNVTSLNINESLIALDKQNEIVEKIIKKRDFRSFYCHNEDTEKKLEEEFKVSISIENEYTSYYENFLNGVDIMSSNYVKVIQDKMRNSFNLAVQDKSNLLIYPEHSIPFVTLQNLVKKSIDNNIIIMGGLVPLKTKDNVILNLHITIMPIKKIYNVEINDAIIYVRHKKFLSPAENKAIIDNKSSHNGEENINPNLDERYRHDIDILNLDDTILRLTDKIGIKAYNCYEVYDINLRTSPEEVTLIALSVNNKDLGTFDHIINTMAIDQKAFVAQANFADTGGVGIYAPKTKSANRNIISTHKSEGHGKILTSTLNFRDLYKARYNNDYSIKNHWKPTPPNLIKNGIDKNNKGE